MIGNTNREEGGAATTDLSSGKSQYITPERVREKNARETGPLQNR